jgi:lysophospholipase L1-like esterase
MFQVEQALAVAPPADLFLMAFGTNDHRRGQTNAAIVAAYRRAVQRVEAAGTGARVRIATTPWCGDERCDGTVIAELNTQLRGTWPAPLLLDFDSWVDPSVHLLSDHVHMTPAGHAQRLAIVMQHLL